MNFLIPYLLNKAHAVMNRLLDCHSMDQWPMEILAKQPIFQEYMRPYWVILPLPFQRETLYTHIL